MTSQGRREMPEPFGVSFIVGTALTVVALGLAYLALTQESLPYIGSGAGALVAMTIIGMAGCSVGGLTQAPILGWLSPGILAGTILGVVSLGIVAAGLFGWDGALRPVAQLVPGHLTTGATTVHLAIVALGGVIAVKWAIGLLMAVAQVLAPANA
jgi:hypothetical protein